MSNIMPFGIFYRTLTFVLFSILLSACLCFHPATIHELKAIQKNIQLNFKKMIEITNMQDMGWHHSFEKFYRANMENKFIEFIQDEPIYVFENVVDLSFMQFGNRLGYYLEALSFCRLNGLHFVSFFPFDIADQELIAKEGKNLTIINSLPTAILHPNPVSDYKDHLEKVLSKQPYLDGYSYASKNGRVWQNLNSVTSILEAFVSSIDSILDTSSLPIDSFEIVKNSNSKNNLENGILEKIPKAVILFRCSDLFNAGRKTYGFYSFNLYPMIIPKDAKSIYVNTEELSYRWNAGSQTEICRILSHELVKFLSEIYVDSVVTLRRGHAMDSFLQLSKTSLVICAPSTFCIWPSLLYQEKRRKVFVSEFNIPFNSITLPKHVRPIQYPQLFMVWMQELLNDDPNLNKTDVAYRMVDYLKNPSPRNSINPQQFFDNYKK